MRYELAKSLQQPPYDSGGYVLVPELGEWLKEREILYLIKLSAFLQDGGRKYYIQFVNIDEEDLIYFKLRWL